MSSIRPKTLYELLEGARLEPLAIAGNPAVSVTGITGHAQTVSRNDLFVARQGTRVDGHSFISEAAERGAAAVIVDREIPPYPGVTLVRVENSTRAAGMVAQAFYDHPGRKLKIAAVTGTNGKTTTAWVTRAMLCAAGLEAGLSGTLGLFWRDTFAATDNTTPDPITLARAMHCMVEDGVKALAMEASSHGIHQHRLAGLPIHAGALTGVTQDHLDYHGSYPAYIGVKRRLFFDHTGTTPGGIACLNVCDHVGEELCYSYDGEKVIFAQEPHPQARVFACNVISDETGTRMELVIDGRSYPVRSPLLGGFSAINLTAAAAMGVALGLDHDLIAKGLSAAPPVAGRFESIREGQPFTVAVDYAHTPDALLKVLRAARRLTAGRLLTVFGCGGDRDKTKRQPMGKAAGMLSDHAILTSDNPRNEDPWQIARGAEAGLKDRACHATWETVLDREQAIEKALHLARPGDCVMICGKGHETYQEIAGVRYQFDDREIAREVLRTLTDNWASVPVTLDMRGPAEHPADDGCPDAQQREAS